MLIGSALSFLPGASRTDTLMNPVHLELAMTVCCYNAVQLQNHATDLAQPLCKRLNQLNQLQGLQACV